MFKPLTEKDYCGPLLTAATGIMIFSFMITIITGPTISHGFNLFAFVLIIAAAVILGRNFSAYGFFKKCVLIVHLAINLGVCFTLMYFKYGYFGQHYKNIFRIAASWE